MSTIWTDTLIDVPNNTSFGFYDNDSAFVNDAKASSKWVARRLGYPILDVELDCTILYSIFEESVSEYGRLVNSYNIRDNMLSAYGSQITTSSLQGKRIKNPQGRLITLSNEYGSMVGVGGDVTYYSGSLIAKTGQQTYDLNQWATDNDINSNIIIKQIFNNPKPASTQYYDPESTLSSDSTGIATFGASYGYNTALGAGTMFMLRPVFEDLLRMQMIEIANDVRKSGYGFTLINNQLSIFPVPLYDFRLWFRYVKANDAESLVDESVDNPITDASNIPFNNLVYSSINDGGKQWIRNYFLALSKITLGGSIRGKYANIPISNEKEIQFGNTLLEEGKDEKKTLIDELREMLEKNTKPELLKAKVEEEEALNKILKGYPMGIYIG
jgi:hypothetical protein